MRSSRDGADIERYTSDESRLVGFADEVVWPSDADECAALLARASRERTPVTVSGAGTGVVGGAGPGRTSSSFSTRAKRIGAAGWPRCASPGPDPGRCRVKWRRMDTSSLGKGIVLLGAFLRLTPYAAESQMSDEHVYAGVEKALRKYFGKRGDRVVQDNLTCVKRGYGEMQEVPAAVIKG